MNESKGVPIQFISGYNEFYKSLIKELEGSCITDEFLNRVKEKVKYWIFSKEYIVTELKVERYGRNYINIIGYAESKNYP